MRRLVVAVGGALAAAAIIPAPALANESPTTGPDFYRLKSTAFVLTVRAPGVLANDSDPDGDQLRAFPLGDSSHGGTVELKRNGAFTYHRPPGVTGLDTFDYLAVDGTTSTWGHAYISITKPPVAHDDDYAALTATRRVVREPGLLANDEGADIARVQTPPAHGDLRLRADGRFAYTSEPGFTGTDAFEYRAVVAGETPSVATATIRVKSSDHRPQAVDDTFTTPEDTPLSIGAPGVLANDSDADGDPLTVEYLTFPGGEDFQALADGSFEYTPPLNFDSPVSFQYRIFDGLRYSDPATATILIPAVDDPPYAEGDVYELRGAASIAVPAPGVLANDYDEVESDIVLARLIETTHKGALTLRADGSFDYVRRPGAVGRDSFLYQAYDSGGAVGDTVLVDLFPHHQ